MLIELKLKIKVIIKCTTLVKTVGTISMHFKCITLIEICV